MSWSIYDANGFVEDLAKQKQLEDFYNNAAHLPFTSQFIELEEADSHHIDLMLKELQYEKGFIPDNLRDILHKAVPPIILSDGAGDPRIEQWDDPDETDPPAYYDDL